jgi:hypothetical protein
VLLYAIATNYQAGQLLSGAVVDEFISDAEGVPVILAADDHRYAGEGMQAVRFHMDEAEAQRRFASHPAAPLQGFVFLVPITAVRAGIR